MLKDDTIGHYSETYQIEWANNLPEGCPPERILVPENEEFYRLLLNKDKIVEEDLKPYSELYPEREEIIKNPLSSGLSISKQGDFKQLTRLPKMKRFKGLAKFKLNPTDGVLIKSGGPDHYTWWRTKSFDAGQVEIVNYEEA